MTTPKPVRNPLIMNIVGKWIYDHNIGAVKVIAFTDETVCLGNPKIDLYDITDLDEDDLIKRDPNTEIVEYKIRKDLKGLRNKIEEDWHFLIPQPPKLYYFSSGPQIAALSTIKSFKHLKVFSSLRELIHMFRSCPAPVQFGKLNNIYDDYIKRKKEAKAEMIRVLVKKSPLPVELKKMITEWM